MPEWRVAGSYFEACNCNVICPCRRRDGRKVTSGSTYGVCEFALSWFIEKGRLDTVDLGGCSVVLAGSYRDDEEGKPWRVCLYVDRRASAGQHDALSGIFLGRLGGSTFQNFARSIGEVHAIRRADIELDHRPGRWFARAEHYVTITASEPVVSREAITCGIPGHDRPGQEVHGDVMRVADAPLHWDVRSRCGFASTFAYQSDSA